MNNLKDFDKFNEELDFNTYINAAKGLNRRGHEKRAKDLTKHALNMRMKNYQSEFTIWPDSPSNLKSITAKNQHGGTEFKVVFTDLSRGDSMWSDHSFEFNYYIFNEGKDNEEEEFYFKSYSDDEDGETTTHRLFTNRQDAIKFKKIFGQWLNDNGYEKCIPAFNGMSLNSLYTDKKLKSDLYLKDYDSD